MIIAKVEQTNKRSLPWVAFARILKLFPLPQPRIVHRYAKPWVNLHDEEPDALIGLVRVREGEEGNLLPYP